MEKRIVKTTEQQYRNLFGEITENYFDRYPIFDYSNKHVFHEDLNNYHVVPYNSNMNYTIEEGIMRTYPTDITINHVYKTMKNYDIDIMLPNEKQADPNIANHIVVRMYLASVDLSSELKLKKAFKSCGYELSAYRDDSIGLPIRIYQFEPIYQNTVNEKIGDFIYHVTTKNVLPKILKQGFKPFNSNKIGFMYDGRCYFFLNTKYISDYVLQFNKSNKEFIDNNLQETKDYVLIQIKTENIKKYIKFYPGGNFPSDIAIFCYANMPPTEITNYYYFKIEN